jgi:hypothetical protein
MKKTQYEVAYSGGYEMFKIEAKSLAGAKRIASRMIENGVNGVTSVYKNGEQVAVKYGQKWANIPE